MQKNIKWTKQRRVIYEAVVHAEDHPTANDIMDTLREQGHRFAYATIYNSLRYLVEIGLIRELKLSGAVSHFDARVEEHLHVICDVCGQVAEAAVDLPTSWLEAVSKATAFRLESPEIILHGVCPSCLAKSGA